MGNCAKQPTKIQRKETQVIFDKFYEQPDDTNSFVGKDLPTLDIRPLLRKVKVKNSPQKKIGVRFLIGGDDQVLLPEKSIDENNAAKWEIQQNFQYLLTEYQLRKRFLLIELISNGAVLSTLKINMYLLAIGPYHLDFQFPMNIASRPRISLDFKMSQVVSLNIETESVQVYQMKQVLGQQYAFSLKTIIGNNPKVSQLSSIFKVDHDPPDDLPVATWDKSRSPLPSINGSVPFYQFHYATLKYIFYKIDNMSKTGPPEKIVAECFISFTKLLGNDSSTIVAKDKIEYQIKNISLQEKLWSNGKQCGKVKLKIKFQIQKHLKQMLVCVRTQKGITKMSPVFQAGGSAKQINKQITQLEQISEKLLSQQGQLQKRRQKFKRQGGTAGSLTGLTKQSYNILEKSLQREYQILQKSSKQSLKIFEYANQQQLMKGQNFLLKLGDKLLKYINEGQQSLKNSKWKVLNSLVQRGQFALNYIGIDSDNKNLNNPTFIAKKKSLGLKYQQFLYRLLQLTLKTLGIKGYSEEKKFAEAFCAVAYFRVPQFRQRLLSLIDKPDDPEIDQWRGTDFSLKANYSDFKTYLVGENTFQILFDWDKYFYNYLKNEPEYQTNIMKLNKVLENRQWQTRISRRRGAFFAFIREWVAYVTTISVRIVHSNWKHFPGYIQIIRSLMAEMKIREVRQYPPSIKQACSSLLYNQNLLNTFITIVFNKTSLNNNFDVIKIMDLTNSFFNSIKKQNKRIPSTFNYSFFYSGIKMVLENLYSYSAGKALHLLYEQFEFFSYQFRIQLCNYLLGRIFFKLFLHWSYNVRVIFHHLLVVRIYKFFTGQLKIENIDPETRVAIRAISARYSQLLIILQNVSKIKSKRFIPTTQNELFKKLRNNIRKKKKLLRGGKDADKMESLLLDQIPDTNLAEEKNIRPRQETIKIMNELSRPKLERYDSQLISKDITIALSSENPKKKKDEIIRKKVNFDQKMPQRSSTQQITQQIIRKKAAISMNTPQQVAMPLLSQQDVRYVGTAMSEYNLIGNNYLDNLKKNRGDPLLKLQIMLDSSEMKPEQYTDVQDW